MKANKKRITLDLANLEKTALVGKALSSEVRLEILKYLIENSANISEIAAAFGLPQSSAALHVKVLEEAGMISVNEKPGVRGAQKVCGISFEDIYINAFQHKIDHNSSQVIRFPMPIGNYFDCEIGGNCGIVSEKGYLGVEDFAASFYCQNRNEAQLLWFEIGYLEYRFPAYMVKNVLVKEISFSFEICSEAPGYQNDWPSDITVWVNGQEVDTITSKGDFGGRRGRLNPEWWGDTMTQYGVYKVIKINQLGCYEDDVKCSDQTVDSLHLGDGNYISLKLGVKPDAAHVGGMNLFGEKFGDYAQGLVMTVKVDDER
ncbi:MAG: helix-turn-helix domain-containing protein [Lachnospiraceae bacterium]|nr:helix-turn-helix domain-containing protein [Lachnospiraceae bacterium]